LLSPSERRHQPMAEREFNVVAVEVTGRLGRQSVDEEAYPFLIHGNFRPPDFMVFAFVMLHGGSEEFYVRGDSLETCLGWCGINHFDEHPRLRWVRVSDGSGKVVASLSRESRLRWIDADVPSRQITEVEVERRRIKLSGEARS
jgi:hypothetical protein